MLKYLIIQLSRDAVSFCHYQGSSAAGELLPPDILRQAIFWAMKENLNIQFLFPDYELPQQYKEIIDSIDHTSIISESCQDSRLRREAEVVVASAADISSGFSIGKGRTLVLRLSKDEFFTNPGTISSLLPDLDRLVVVITDIDKFREEDFSRYRETLESFIPLIKNEYVHGHPVQFNLLTDRMVLDRMNSCGAGEESITLAPDGKFYICPAFYLEGDRDAGSLQDGPDIPNKQLYRLDHAPICRSCDAYQCHRCVWLNRKMTLEVNTPSHEQCVVAHIERNASRALLERIRELGLFLPGKDIPEIDYLDPFENVKS